MLKRFGAVLLASGLLGHAAQAGKADNTLNIAFDAAPATLDAYKESDRPGLALARMLFTGLLQKNHDTGEFGPGLATSYRFIDDTTIELVLREGVKFHDGSPLTMDDVLYTLNLVSSDAYQARFQNQVTWIAKAEQVTGNTMRIKMKFPYPLALEMLSENLPIYPRQFYAANQPPGREPAGQSLCV